MRKNGIPVTYVVFEDEGHGFAHPANNLRFFAVAESFLADALGGRVEPPAADEDIRPYLR
jgi:dipeptidyl aminopeptidase/acylaminoacyl peptidase